METFQDAEDKVTTALLLLAAAAEIFNLESETRHHHDKTMTEALAERRVFQIHAAVSFLTSTPENDLPQFPDSKTLKFYPEADSQSVTE